MSGQFKVGEVLVGQNFVKDPSYNGKECVVLEGAQMLTTMCTTTREILNGLKYRVRWTNGRVTCQPVHTLRRKQPPSGEQSVLDIFKLPAPSTEFA